MRVRDPHQDRFERLSAVTATDVDADRREQKMLRYRAGKLIHDWPPDLAAEVAPPSQTKEVMAAKARQYLIAGTALVWVVWPEQGEVDVWRPADTVESAVAWACQTSA